jgi:hypothetical protein
MDKDYEQLKEARIALLCVGDVIYRVYAGKAYAYKERSTLIAVCKVTQVLGKNSIRVTRSYTGNGTIECPLSIDMCDGKLYIWNHGSHFYGYPPKERLAELTKILKLENIRYESFNG